MNICDLTPAEVWNAKTSAPWDTLVEAYWRQPTVRRTLNIHTQLEELNRDDVLGKEPEDWYRWVRDTFMPWQFDRWTTDRQRDIDGQWSTEAGRSAIDRVRTEMEAAMEHGGFDDAVSLAMTIEGIGVSAGSALVALLFPDRCATGDERVVSFLLGIPDLPEREELLAIPDPKDLRLSDAAMICRIAVRQAAELNRRFELESWTPRLVERCVWTYDSACGLR